MNEMNAPGSVDPTPVDVPPPVQDEKLKVSSSELSVIPGSPRRFTPLLLVLALLILAAGIFYFLNKPKAPQVQVTPEAPAAKPASLFLKIQSPSGPVTAVNGEILVSGKTLPNTAVLMFSDVDEASIDSDEQGNFEETVVVGDNGGILRVTAYGENGEEESRTFQVAEGKPVSYAGGEVLGISDTAPGKEKKELAQESDDQPGSDSVKNAPPGKANKPTAKPTLDPKTKKQISDFVENKVPEKKSPKVGIGKLKLALTGEGTGSAELKGMKLKKLQAQVATPGAALKRHAVEGVITGLADGTITISHQVKTDRITTVYYNSSTVFHMKGTANATAAVLKVGMRIAAVGDIADDGILAKRIHVIPGLATGVFQKNPVSSPSGTITPSPSASVSGTPTVTVSPTIVLTPTVTANATPTEEPLTPTPTL